LMLADGRVQGIEADLLRNPEDTEKVPSGYEWVEGVLIDGQGAAQAYSLWGRAKGGNGYEFRRRVSPSSFIHYGFFDRFATDQVRGVSPIAAALNNFRDVYENLDYALVKAKISQLFAIALMRDADADGLEKALPGEPIPDGDLAIPGASDVDETKPREINLQNGPTVLDLDPGEKIEVVESETPSNQLQDFSRLVVMIAMKCLDIPYSFFDESHTNYSGSRGSWLLYERAVLDKRDDQLAIRTRWANWQYARWILDKQLTLPRGMSVEQLRFEWVPLGMPWWDPGKELTGDMKACAAGFDSPQRVAKERGRGDIFDNIEDTIEVLKYARDRGEEVLGYPHVLNFDPGPFPSTMEIPTEVQA
jgi:capsid protein